MTVYLNRKYTLKLAECQMFYKMLVDSHTLLHLVPLSKSYLTLTVLVTTIDALQHFETG